MRIHKTPIGNPNVWWSSITAPTEQILGHHPPRMSHIFALMDILKHLLKSDVIRVERKGRSVGWSDIEFKSENEEYTLTIMQRRANCVDKEHIHLLRCEYVVQLTTPTGGCWNACYPPEYYCSWMGDSFYVRREEYELPSQIVWC